MLYGVYMRLSLPSASAYCEDSTIAVYSTKCGETILSSRGRHLMPIFGSLSIMPMQMQHSLFMSQWASDESQSIIR